jgi:hypothetical protein
MKLTLQLQLLPTPAQAVLLRETMAAFNGAASYAAQVGFEAKVYGQPGLHKRCGSCVATVRDVASWPHK